MRLNRVKTSSEPKIMVFMLKREESEGRMGSDGQRNKR